MRQNMFLTINQMQECVMRLEHARMLFLLIVLSYG